MIKFISSVLFIVLFSYCSNEKPISNHESENIFLGNHSSFQELSDSAIVLDGDSVYVSSYYVKSTNDEPEQIQSDVYISFSDSTIKVSMVQPISKINVKNVTTFKSKLTATKNKQLFYEINNNNIFGELFFVPSDSLIIIDYSKDSYYFYDVMKM